MKIPQRGKVFLSNISSTIAVFIFAVLLAIVPIVQAVSVSPNEASGWWQVAIETLGLPLLLYALYGLQKTVKESQWKPEIRIGLAFGGLPVSLIRLKQEVKTVLPVNQGYPCFSLVIQNIGLLAAKYVKIHLEYLSFTDSGDVDIDSKSSKATHLDIPESNPFKWQNNVDYVFQGGIDWVIYSQDLVSFVFNLDTSVEGFSPALRDYRFRCTVWAEGLDTPVVQELIIKVVKYDVRPQI